MTGISRLNAIIDLFLVSFLALYFEILFIRWVPSLIQITAYFVNFILLSSFLGLGIGCLLTENKLNLTGLFFPSILIMVFLIKKISAIPLQANLIRGEYLVGFYNAQGVSFLVIILTIFILNAAVFITLGQKLGSCLKCFQPLFAYSINIAGGITGVVVFSALSYLMLAPLHWFLLGLALALWFYISSKRQMILQIFVAALILYNVLAVSDRSHWSPYYKIDVSTHVSQISHKVLGLFISANNTYLQYALDLSDKSVAAAPVLKHFKDIYEFPYNFIRPESVLILGAGSGNDAAAALRKSISNISAVEIDPYIANLGKTEHPERPYRSGSVRLYIDDARSFVKRTNEKFDLVAFGYLDAHKIVSQFSIVRLDCFAYTEESFRDVKNLLTQNGMVSVTCLVFKEWIMEKMYAAMKNIFGDDLKIFRTSTYSKDDTAVFLAGPGVRHVPAATMPGFELYDGLDHGNVSAITDDWPYLYLMNRGIPVHYLIILGAILAISFLSIFYIEAEPFQKFNGHFFFLGAGFMLLETVWVTRSALLFGSTWVVNSAAIISILCAGLLANIYINKTKALDVRMMYMLLIGFIFLNWLLKPDFYLSVGKPLGIALSSLALALPLFFAGMIFSGSFKETKDVSAAFAYNLLGAVAGGACEYISMVSGFDFLLILAAAVYYLSYASMAAEKKRQNIYKIG